MCPCLSRMHFNTTPSVSFFGQRKDPLMVELGPLQPVTKGSRDRVPFLSAHIALFLCHVVCPRLLGLAAECTYPSQPVRQPLSLLQLASSCSLPSLAHPLRGSIKVCCHPATLTILPTFPFLIPSSFLFLLRLSFQLHIDSSPDTHALVPGTYYAAAHLPAYNSFLS